MQDPITHHNFSPCNAFDNNPVYWADPSGADASDMMGTDMDGNQRYTVGGLYVPKAERDGRSNTFYMGGGGTTSYGKADFLGKWVKHKVGTEVTYAKDNGDSLLEEIIFKNIYEYEFVLNNRPIDDFMYGFMNAPSSNFQSTSSWLGYAGLNIAKYEGLFKYTAKTTTGWANKAYALRAARNAKILGNTLGVLGAFATAIEGYTDGNGFTAGDGVKVAIGLLTTFTPYGWAYGLIDVGVGLATGTTITDRIGEAIDGSINNN